MQLLTANALRAATPIMPLPDACSIHLWFCDHSPRAPEQSHDPNATTRALLMPILTHYPDMPPLMLNRSAHGKPFFDAQYRLDFNLSHSGKHAMIAFARGHAIGVDLEHTGRKRDVLALAQRFFCINEFESLAALPESLQQRAFLQLWTCKEAVLKAIGRGIAFGLQRLEFALNQEGMPTHLHTIARDGGNVADWQVLTLQPTPDYLGALAWRGPTKQVLYFRNDSDGLG